MEQVILYANCGRANQRKYEEQLLHNYRQQKMLSGAYQPGENEEQLVIDPGEFCVPDSGSLYFEVEDTSLELQKCDPPRPGSCITQDSREDNELPESLSPCKDLAATVPMEDADAGKDVEMPVEKAIRRRCDARAPQQTQYVVYQKECSAEGGDDCCADQGRVKVPRRKAHRRAMQPNVQQKRLLAKLDQKRQKRKARNELYDINNVIYTSVKGKASNQCTDQEGCKKLAAIAVPQFKVLPSSYYDQNEEEDKDGSEEYTEDRCEEVHRQYELSEACHQFLSGGQELAEQFKGGLRIKLRLPKDSSELPSIIQ